MTSHSINASWSYGHLVIRTQTGAPLLAIKLDAAWGTPSGRLDIDAIDLKRDRWLADLWAYVEGHKVTREQTRQHMDAVAACLDLVVHRSEVDLAAWADAMNVTKDEMRNLNARLAREFEEVHRRLSSMTA